MKNQQNKEYFILFYILIITGIYPVFFLPDKIALYFSRYSAVLFHYSIIFIFFGLIPMLVLKFVFKEKLTEYGLNFNNFKAGLKFIIIVLPLLAVLIWLSVKDPAVMSEYPLAKSISQSCRLFLIMEFFYLLYYIGWEFFFRGFTVLGLMKLKKYPLVIPIIIETMASTLLHYSKPTGEIFLSLIAGLILGWTVYKYKTIWFAVCIHFFAGLMMDIFVIIRN